MTKFVSIAVKGDKSPNDKYVKQTNDMLSNVNSNLELIATQIGQLPIREQIRFFRLILNYIDITAMKSTLQFPPAGLVETIELCGQLIDTANNFYFEKDNAQMELPL
jgi:hypothetical protein